MATKTGIVESVARSGKALQIDGEWYSAFTPGALNGASKGDSVKFNYKDVDKGGVVYHNIQGNVSVSEPEAAASASAPRAAAPTGFSKGGRSFPVGALDPERSIIRQNALTQANKMLENCNPLSFDGDFEKIEEHAHRVIAVARIFESYSAGDLDAAEAAEAIAEMKAAMGAS